MNVDYRFPSRHPVWVYGACVIAVLFYTLLLWWTFESQLDAVQRLYFPVYVKTCWFGQSPLSVSEHRVLYVVTATGASRVGVDGEFEPVTLENGRKSYALTAYARNEGFVSLVSRRGRFKDHELYEYLRHNIYDDLSLWDYAAHPTYAALAFGFVIAFLLGSKDKERARIRRDGIRLDGPQLVTPSEFNRILQADGIGLIHAKKRSLLQLQKGGLDILRVPKEVETQHFLVLGDTGTGKSAIMRQLLLQIHERGEAAVIYDPAREYVSEFAGQGDTILNPLDARCPYWSPSDEVSHEAESLTVATSLFPEQKDEHAFFADAKRRVFARLLAFKPSPQELISWMCNAEEIDRRVRGSDAEPMIDPHAGGQRGGVLASLNMIATSLRLLPRESQTRQRWSSVEWMNNRRGFLFLTSWPSAHDALQPLVSMWLDLLILRALNEGKTAKPPVWFLLDEAADLKHLPQLAKALAQSRKSNCRIVLGFQGIDQIDSFYGRMGKTMISQPHCRVYMRTGEPDAAKWISSALGEVTVVRLRETSTTDADGKRTVSETIDPPRPEPLVPYSTVLTLPKLHGFLKCENLVVALHAHYLNLPARCKGFIARPMADHSVLDMSPCGDGVATTKNSSNENAIFFQ